MSNDPLSRAAEIVGGSRCETYGKPIDNHSCTAALWSAWLSRKLRTPITLTATDVCWFNILQKCSREANKHDDDNPVDVCGYAQNDWLCRQAESIKTEITLPNPPGHYFMPEFAVSEKCPGSEVPALMKTQAAAGSPMPEPQSVRVHWVWGKTGFAPGQGTVKLPNRVIYVHGPFTNGGKFSMRDRAINTKKAIEAGIKLTEKGWLPHVPHAATGCLDSTTDLDYEDYMELDHTMLAACSAGFRVKGPSVGADRENDALRASGKPVWYNIADVPDIQSQLRDAKIPQDE